MRTEDRGSRVSEGAMKLTAVLAAIAMVLISALGWMYWRCGQERYDRLLLARSASARGIDVWQVEDFCRDEFLITYEIGRNAAAESHNYRQPVTLVGTNSYYPQILGYRLTSGGFFSAASWKAGNKEAVLNAAAAFKLFGSDDIVGQLLKIDRETWLITGVLDDGDGENPRVYVPSSVIGGTAGNAGIADSLIVLLDGRPVNAEYAKNGLKQLDVYDGAYTIINLAAAGAAFGQRLMVSVYFMLILTLALLVRRFAGRLISRLPYYQGQFQSLYLRELLSANRGDISKLALTVFALLGGIAALMALALQILKISLGWPGLLPEGHDWAMGSFAVKLAWLHDWHLPGIILFAALLIVLAALFAAVWRQGKSAR